MRTYGDLVDDVRAFLNRKDLEEKIPRFIMLAESDLFRRLRATCNEGIVTYTEAFAGYPIIGAVRLPDSCIELKSVVLDGRPLQYVSDAEYFRRLHRQPPQAQEIESEAKLSYWQNPEGDFPDWLQPPNGKILVGTGRPEVFTRIQNYLCFHPVSDKRDLTVYVSMYAFDGPLDSVNYQTNTLQDAYNAYLYGALSHAEGYLMNDPRIALWKSKFEECLGQMNGTKTDADLGSVQEVRSAYA
ncbi:MAG: hypothetical protein VXA88_09605 [Rhodospirillales bacterium]